MWESGPTDLPDGFAIARSGNLYVPLAGAANQIAVVAPDGRELERFPSAPGDGGNGSPVPFDTPSSARFLGTRLMVANQSFTGNREHQALLDVETGEEGLPELIPGLDRDPPALSRVSLSRKRVPAGRRDASRALQRERAVHGHLQGRAAHRAPLAGGQDASRAGAAPGEARWRSGPAAYARAATAWCCAPRTPRATARRA